MIYPKRKTLAYVIASEKLVEHQGGTRQKSQTEASSALLTEWTVDNNFNQKKVLTLASAFRVPNLTAPWSQVLIQGFF